MPVTRRALAGTALAAATVTALPVLSAVPAIHASAAAQLRKLIADWHALDDRREKLADRIAAGYVAVKEAGFKTHIQRGEWIYDSEDAVRQFAAVERALGRAESADAALAEYDANCDAWLAELDRRGVFALERLDDHLADAQDRIEDQIIAFPVGDMDTARAKIAALPAMFARETDEGAYYRLPPHMPALIESFSTPPLPASPRLVTETKAA